jgi:hypothetical protein
LAFCIWSTAVKAKGYKVAIVERPGSPWGNQQKHGIHVSTENILGVPQTNLSHDLRTLDFELFP